MGPTGNTLSFEIDGNTTTRRSRKIAVQPMKMITTSGLCAVGGRPVSRLSRYENGTSAPTIRITHASVRHGSTKKRERKNRVSTGTLPNQITRYCEKKKYIHITHMANVSLATSWIADGDTAVSPRALPRMVRNVT